MWQYDSTHSQQHKNGGEFHVQAGLSSLKELPLRLVSISYTEFVNKIYSLVQEMKYMERWTDRHHLLIVHSGCEGIEAYRSLKQVFCSVGLRTVKLPYNLRHEFHFLLPGDV